MAHDAAQRREARRRYVIERQSLPTIEAATGIKASTLSRWKREAKASGDDWEQFRNAHTIAGEGLESILASAVEDFVHFAQATMTQIKAAGDDIQPTQKVELLAKLADATGKMVASAGRLAPRLSELGIAEDVLKRLAKWIGEHHPDQAPSFIQILPEFGNQLAEIFGK